MLWKPHNYQLEAVKFLLSHGGAGLFAFPGSGKTSATLAALNVLFGQGLASKVLLIAPLRVCYNVWPKEIAKWDQFKDITATVLHGSKKQEALQQDANIYVINPEGLNWLFSQKNLPRFDTLVVDELSKFKHPNTKRFKCLKPFLAKFSRRWGLTGSPASNGLLDLFGQMYVLDMGRSLGAFITHYRMKYFTPDYMGYEWTLRPGADKEIHERIRPLVMILQADDSGLDLPDLVENIIEVNLPNEAMQIYRMMEAALVAQIKERTVTAANAAAASTKCRQIVNGGVYHDIEPGIEKRGVEEIHTTKVEALKELVEELQGEPLLVAYAFDHDLERIKAVLGDVPHIGGGVSAKRAEEIIERWNAGRIPVLLAHPATLAHGVNLQSAGHHLCWFSPTWDFEHHDQFIRRIWRQGQKSSRVVVHYIVAKGTIDEVILKVLRGKERTQNALFDALKELGN